MPKKNNELYNGCGTKSFTKKETKLKKAKLIPANENSKDPHLESSDILMNNYEKGNENVDKMFPSVIEKCKENIFNELNQQNSNRKLLHEKITKNLSGVLNQLEKDKAVIKENNEKLSYILEQSVKASQQGSSTIKLRITGLHEILNMYNKQVEGLMRSNAIKPQDRPLWWDIYRAFPPHTEPLYSRPLPTENIRKIFYPEDEIRGKFHKSGQPLGTVRLADDRYKTNSQKFLALYKNLENTSENVENKDEMFKECEDMLQEYFALKNEWKDHSTTEEMIKAKTNIMEKPKTSPEDKQKTAPPISENVIKDIFKE